MKEIHVPQYVHSSVYAGKWFEGVSWSPDESLIAYVAKEPTLFKPTLIIRVTKKTWASLIRIVIGGKVKVIGKTIRAKRILEKDRLLYLSLILTGYTITLLHK